MSYVITGSPGTGKHTIGKILADNLELDITDINLLATESRLYEKTDGVIEVDTDALSKIIDNTSGVIIGHLAPYVVKQAKFVIVLRKSPYELQAVYEQRKYSKEKSLENIQAEILGIIAHDALQTFSDLIQIDVTGCRPDDIVSRIKNRSNSTVDWLQLISERDDIRRFFPERMTDLI
ncbi:MAG: Nucleoside kinase [Cenarchaeum symbiont of Oopsacas minuta]|nr:Nucleoside kinase [Cenarchaeum symbiont of Oopsacas minuta]